MADYVPQEWEGEQASEPKNGGILDPPRCHGLAFPEDEEEGPWCAKGAWVELCCKALPGASWALPVWCNLCPIPLFLSLGPARQSQCPAFFLSTPMTVQAAGSAPFSNGWLIWRPPPTALSFFS